MAQTRSSQIGGSKIYHDSVATQLEIISEKLDFLLSLKNDIASIREAWLARPKQLTKEPENEPHEPLPDPVKEEDHATLQQLRSEIDGVSKIGGLGRVVGGISDNKADDGMGAGYMGKNMDRRQRASPFYGLHNFGSRCAADGKQLIEIDRALGYGGCFVWTSQVANKEISIRIKYNSALGSYISGPLATEAGQPTIEWMIAWCNNYWLFDLRKSRVSGPEVLIRSQLLLKEVI